MPGIMTNDDKQKLDYRKRELDRALEQLKNTINGRNSSFLPFITDKEGNVTDEKLEAFIDELLRPLGEMGKADREELYRCFLYCAITGFSDYDERYRPDEFMAAVMPEMLAERLSRSFEDIIELTHGLTKFRYSDELERAEYESEMGIIYPDQAYEQLGRFYLFADRMYYLITGRAIHKTFDKTDLEMFEEENTPAPSLMFTDEDMEAMSGSGKDDNSQIEDASPAQTVPYQYAQEQNSWMDEAFDEECRLAMGYETRKEWEQWKMTVSEAAKTSYEHRFDHLPDRDRYVAMYTKLRSLLFPVSLEDTEITADMVELADRFLFGHGLSGFSLGDRFGLITYNLDRADKFMQKLIRRGGAAK